MTASPDLQQQLTGLYAEIKQIYIHFREIRGEAEGIIHASSMPDSKLQLEDVLQATEEATTTILDAATAISTAIAETELDDAHKHQVGAEIGKIYEACSFQDITGQRIKKVLQRLGELEAHLLRLSNAVSAKSDTAAMPPASQQPASLMNGPQLTSAAPTQESVDALFNNS